mgnify:CR=1 FL=1
MRTGCDLRITLCVLCFVGAQLPDPVSAQVPAQLDPWLSQQTWKRDVDGPIISLGRAGEFDDTHIFAPAVVRDAENYWLWYCGSQGFAYDLAPTRTVDERVFRLGLATSEDGKQFSRHAESPVFALADPKRSVLTPSILKNADGTALREDGHLRMWFSAGTLGGGGAPHSIHETTSKDGVTWAEPSDAQIERAYAPSVIKTESGYEMWYTVPGQYPWVINHATSDDGSAWSVAEKPALDVSQEWEHDLVIYPHVLKLDDVYLMWYASYTSDDHKETAIGFAASLDGINWHKHPDNPVLRPARQRSWESHYVSSHSVMQLPDSGFRIWYASRKQPPFQNLYFALNTAVWAGPK